MPKLPANETTASTDLEIQARIRRGRQSRIILEDAVFQEALAIAQGEVTRDWANSPAEARDEQAEAHGKLNGIAHILDVFNRFVQDGKQLEDQQEQDGT